GLRQDRGAGGQTPFGPQEAETMSQALSPSPQRPPETAAPLPRSRLERISHTTERIGVANQRKPLFRNNSSSTRGAPRCRQSVARISLDLNLLKAARW